MNVFNSRTAFIFIFAISGFSGLIYESIWTHYLKLFLGHSAYAQTLVLAIFMGGMAIGALLCSRFSARWKNLLIGYAICEAIIGISALLFHDLFNQLLTLSYETVFPLLGSYMGITTYKWTLAALLILPQSILLGMTFPLMSAGILRRHPSTPGSSIALLYFSNSFGGALGVLASGFIFVNMLGLPGTIMLAGTINLLLAAGVWVLCRKDNFPAPPAPVKQDKKDELLLPLLAISLLTGAASFIYEISWIRMLSMVLSSSSHAFELMLSAFILGLAFGGLLIRRYIDRLSDSIRTLAWIQIAMGLFAIGTLLVYNNTFEMMQWLIGNLEKNDNGYLLFNFGSHGIAMLIMLPTTLCAGMTLPLITYTLLRRGRGEGAIGAVYSSNTLGAIIGVLFAVHIGLPLLGLKNLMIFAAAIDIVLGIYLLQRCGSPQRLRYLAPVAALLVLSLSVVLIELDTLKMASGVYRNASLLNADQFQVIDDQDGKTASITLVQNNQQLTIATNGKPDASIQMDPQRPAILDENTMTLLAALPMLVKPDARLVANIGFGSGLSSHVFMSNPHIERLDSIEIEQAVIEVAKGFSPRNDLAYQDPRSHIHIEDAKTFFSSHQLKYDIILSEPSNPWVSGVSGLFSDEFYGLIKHHLSEGGIFAQWVQLYEISPELVASIIKPLAAHFPYFEIFAANHGDIIILASLNEQDFALNKALFNEATMRDVFHRIDIHSVADLQLLKVANREMIMPLIDSYGIRANSDFYPVLDQYAAKSRFLGENSTSLIAQAYYPLPLLEMLNVKASSDYEGRISDSLRYKSQHNAFIAQQIHDELTGSTRHLPNEARQIVNANTAMLRECQIPAHRDRIYDLNRLVFLLLPTLSDREMGAIWQQLINPECISAWSQREQLWLQLFYTISVRDSAKFAQLAETLLANDKYLTLARQKYLLAAAMLGYIAEQQPEKALSLWQHYSPHLFSGPTHLPFSLLLAHAKLPSAGMGMPQTEGAGN